MVLKLPGIRYKGGMVFFEQWWLAAGRKMGRSNVTSIKFDGREAKFDRPVSIWRALKAISDQRSGN